MTIDPLKIPCPFCGTQGVRYETVEMRRKIVCDGFCEVRVSEESWITGGINAMAGKLIRKGVRFDQGIDMEQGQWHWSNPAEGLRSNPLFLQPSRKLF